MSMDAYARVMRLRSGRVATALPPRTRPHVATPTTCAPPRHRPLRDDDHVRGDPARPLLLFYADFTCPRCALAHERLVQAGARVAFRHFALRAKHPSARSPSPAPPRPPRPRARSGRSSTRCTPTRAGSTTRICGSTRASSGSISSASTRDRRADRAAARVREDTRAALAAGATTTPAVFCRRDGAFRGSRCASGWRDWATMRRFVYRSHDKTQVRRTRRAHPNKRTTSYEYCRDPCLR